MNYYLLNGGAVVRVKTNEDGSTQHQVIDPANVDFQVYQQWLAEGNTPLSAEE